MRLANLNGRATLLVDGGGIDIATASQGRFGPDIHDVYDHWVAFRDAAAGLATGEAVAFDDAALGPPAPHPRQVFAIGLNYKAHAAEAAMALPAKPAVFTKYPTCLTGPFADVPLVDGMIDWEVELVVVIGPPAHRVTEADAWAHVAGLTVGQDISERGLQFAAGGQFSLGKSYPGFGPTGPWLVTPDELSNPDRLRLGCAIAGEALQDADTSDMVFDIASLVAELSAVVPLLPGDLIFTGTPGGVGITRTPPRFLQPGDVLESWVEGIGTIRNQFVTRETTTS